MTKGEQALLHTPESAGRALNLGRTTIFELMATGQLESVKIGRSRRIPHDALVAYVTRIRARTS